MGRITNRKSELLLSFLEDSGTKRETAVVT